MVFFADVGFAASRVIVLFRVFSAGLTYLRIKARLSHVRLHILHHVSLFLLCFRFVWLVSFVSCVEWLTNFSVLFLPSLAPSLLPASSLLHRIIHTLLDVQVLSFSSFLKYQPARRWKTRVEKSKVIPITWVDSIHTLSSRVAVRVINFSTIIDYRWQTKLSITLFPRSGLCTSWLLRRPQKPTLRPTTPIVDQDGGCLF